MIWRLKDSSIGHVDFCDLFQDPSIEYIYILYFFLPLHCKKKLAGNERMRVNWSNALSDTGEAKWWGYLGEAIGRWAREE